MEIELAPLSPLPQIKENMHQRKSLPFILLSLCASFYWSLPSAGRIISNLDDLLHKNFQWYVLGIIVVYPKLFTKINKKRAFILKYQANVKCVLNGLLRDYSSFWSHLI